MSRPKAIDQLAPAAPAASYPNSYGNDWFDLKEMARRLHVSPLTVRRMIKRGDLYEPAYFGSQILRFSEEGYRLWYRARAGLDIGP